MKTATCGGNNAEGFDDCFVVTSNQDAGEGTLRKALEEANALPARDVGRRKPFCLKAMKNRQEL